MLLKAAKQPSYNTSKYDFERLKQDADGIAQNLLHYIHGFSPEVRGLFDHFAFEPQVTKLDKTNRLFKLVQKFAEVDLHIEQVSNLEMGRTFEELVRKFNEAANEEAGDHFTPLEVIRPVLRLVRQIWLTPRSFPASLLLACSVAQRHHARVPSGLSGWIPGARISARHHRQRTSPRVTFFDHAFVRRRLFPRDSVHSGDADVVQQCGEFSASCPFLVPRAHAPSPAFPARCASPICGLSAELKFRGRGRDRHC